MSELRRGDQGEAVRAWQRELGVAADGIFGALTEAATRQWQAQRGLEPDGVVKEAMLLAGAEQPMVLGVDVSAIQGTIDWPAVRAAGYEFAVIKATEGLTFLDRARMRNIDGARAAGMLTSVYSFARVSQGQPEAQFRRLWDASGDRMPELRWVLDLESAPSGMAYREVVDFALRWTATALEYDARGACLYSYVSFLLGLAPALTTLGVSLADVPLWIAHYLWRGEGLPPGNVRPRVPAPWARAVMWQCNGGGRPELNGPVIPGVGLPCDRNVFFGTRAELVEWCRLTPEGSPPPSMGGIVHGSDVVEGAVAEAQRRTA